MEMDPPSMTSSFPSSAPPPNTSSFHLADIWQFPLSGNGGVDESGAVLGARRAHFVQNLAGFGENRDISVDESTVTEHTRRNGALVGKKRRDAVVSEEDDSSKLLSTSSGNEMNDCDGKRLKVSGSRDENGDIKAEVEASSGVGNKPAEQGNQPSELPKQDYIHVRARRGQATDSHSLAERVIGKAMVLDEIINYIQSLQRQVEFLSMKLEAVNSRMNPSIDVFPPKDFGAAAYDAAGMTYGPQATRGEYGQGSPPEWLHMQVGGNFERAT